MGLFKKLFGSSKEAPLTASASLRFQESENATEHGSRNAPRRELVQVVLRETMRRHGIPSDWIESRILSVVSRGGRSGMHLHLIVRQGHDRLLAYMPAFQASYLAGLQTFEPHARDWLLSLCWQLEGLSEDGRHPDMPDPGTWTAGIVGVVAGAGAAATATATATVSAASTDDDEVMQDLKALFAIRDAAMQNPAALDHVDFQPTQPGFMNSGDGPAGR